MRRLAAVAAVSAAAAFVAFAGRAGAQVEPPPPDEPTTTAPAPAPPSEPSRAAQTADEVEAVFTGPQIGQHPDNRYRYYTGDGSATVEVPNVPGPFDDLAKAAGVVPREVDTGVPTDRSASGWIADLAWSFGQIAASIVRALVHWLYTFGLLRVVSPIVETIAGVLNGIALGPLRLTQVIWFAVGVALAWRLLMHRRYARFIIDLGIALVLFVAAGVLIARPATYFDGIASLAGEVAQLPFAAVGGDAAQGDPGEGLTKAEVALKELWTVVPWEVTNFGGTLSGECDAAGQRVLAGGPYGKTDDTVRKEMLGAGCQSEARYNNESTPKRTAITLLLGLAGASTAFFVVAMAWSFARALVRIGWQLCYGAYSFLFGALPWTHDIALNWFRDLLHNLVAVIVPSWVLAAMLIADAAILGLDAAIGWQAVLVLLVNVAVFWKRRAVVNGVAARVSGGVNRVHARVTVDGAHEDASRHNTAAQGARGVEDLMVGSKLVTVPLVAAGVAAGRQAASGGNTVRKVRGVAASAAGPVGAAAKGTKAGAALTADRAKEAGGDLAGMSRDLSARAAGRAAEFRAARERRRGVGTAPLDPVAAGPAHPDDGASVDADLLPGWDDRHEPVKDETAA